MVHPPRFDETVRHRQWIHERFSPFRLQLPSEVVVLLCTWPGFESCTRDPFYDIANQSPQSYCSVCTITSFQEVDLTPQSHGSSHPYQLPPPGEWRGGAVVESHGEKGPWKISRGQQTASIPGEVEMRPQACCSMLSCSAPCRNSLRLLMLFEEGP